MEKEEVKEMSKIDEMLSSIKDNLTAQEIELLADRLNTELANIKYNVKQMESALIEADAPDRIIAEGMIELGYPLDKVKEFLSTAKWKSSWKSRR